MRKKEIILNRYNRQELLQQYNKYDLDMKKVRKLQVGDESKIHKPLFWRNDVINAWCISGAVGTCQDIDFGCENGYWIGIYDTEYYGRRFHCYCTAWGGMCSFKFEKFFKSKDIENINDLNTQIKLLENLNTLIDEGILLLPEKT